MSDYRNKLYSRLCSLQHLFPPNNMAAWEQNENKRLHEVGATVRGREGACEGCLKGGPQDCGQLVVGWGARRTWLGVWEVARGGVQELCLDSLPGVGQLVLDQL